MPAKQEAIGKLLVSQGANVSAAVDSTGATALMLASKSNMRGLVVVLLVLGQM